MLARPRADYLYRRPMFVAARNGDCRKLEAVAHHVQEPKVADAHSASDAHLNLTSPLIFGLIL